MGNLPTARTENCIAGASVSHNLINEIQDNIIGHKRPTFVRTFYPKFTNASGFAAGVNPVNATFPLSYNSAGAVANAQFDIEFEDGDRLTNLLYQAAGNGTTDLTFGGIFYAATMGVAPTQLTSWTDVNRAAAWGTVDIGAIGTGPVLSPQVLSAGASLTVQLVTNAAGYSIGTFWAVFDRL